MKVIIRVFLLGIVSRSASRELISKGYTNIFDMTGGTNAWISAGGELDQK